MIRCHQFIWSVLWESVRLRLTLTKDSDNERGNLGCAWFIRNNTYKATRSGNFCQELVHTGQGFKVTQINQWLAMMITSRVHWHKPSNYRYDNVTFFNIRDNGSKTFAYALWLDLVRTQSDRYITNEGLKILFRYSVFRWLQKPHRPMHWLLFVFHPLGAHIASVASLIR